MLTRTPLLVESDLAQQRQDERDRRRRRRERGEEKRTRVLYHIGKKPGFPHPAQSGWAKNTGSRDPDREQGVWHRKGRKPASSGVFLSNNPKRVAPMHGVFGNVYAYDVPEKVIRKSGGIRTFDRATELLVPGEDWKKVKFKGKSSDKRRFNKDVERAMTKHIWGNPFRGDSFFADEYEDVKSKRQKKRDKKAQDIAARQKGRRQSRRRREKDLGRRRQRYDVHEGLNRTPLLTEALKVRRQSSKERMAKRRPSNLFAARRSAKFLWQKMRREWSKKNPQYIFRKGRLIFVPPEKRRQLKSKVKGRIVMRANFPGA